METELERQVAELGTEAAWRQAIELEPRLTLHGLGAPTESRSLVYSCDLAVVERDRPRCFTPDALRQLGTARAWIRHRTRRLKHPRAGSYGLKHRAEHWGRDEIGAAYSYVSNGALIAAALLEGCTVTSAGCLPPNVNVNIKGSD
jgi:hypothetical protein